MPLPLAASITSVPAGVVSFSSLIVNVICFISGMRVLGSSHDHLRGFERTFPAKVVLKFVPPLFHDTDGWQCRCVSQRTERAAQHVFRKLINQRNIFGAASPVMKTVEQFTQPRRALAARNAPAAGFGG